MRQYKKKLGCNKEVVMKKKIYDFEPLRKRIQAESVIG